jgi:hypothetical protein
MNKIILGRLKEAAIKKGLIRQFPDMASMALDIRKKRIEEVGEDNMIDDSAERVKNGIARKARRTKRSLFGETNNV